ncbi:GFA family protein [uncultured Agrobacterium sp.]|uniref:GFA family protein n=1 Tax=uncultured Agrobacterium sp. TaxID=157277 RepID=UPI0025DA0244|nr:GFA family protein [uncultured Agrobacterium sp.]
MRITGQCHCGNVRYEAEADPEHVVICHCTDCQRLTGSPYRVTLRAKRQNIILTGVEPKLYRKKAENGNIRLMHFCSDCGAPLFSSAEQETGTWGIRWGSINERAALEPHVQIWARSRAKWVDDLKEIPAHPKEPQK